MPTYSGTFLGTSTATENGVKGTSTNSNIAIVGFGTVVSGIYGQSSAVSYGAVAAVNTAASGGYGMYAETPSGFGLYGVSTGTSGDAAGPCGVVGIGPLYGVRGTTNDPLGAGAGVYGGSSNIGVYGISGSGYAGSFFGKVQVAGFLTKSGGGFLIDHPIDPDTKLLQHSFVESPDQKNIYDGVITADNNGVAEVELPEYFEALNETFRYQLTPIGEPAPQLHIKTKIQSSRFVIAGANPQQEISWQITGIRKDTFAKANPIVVEQEKVGGERGSYLHPKLLGLDASRQMNSKRFPYLEMPDLVPAGLPPTAP